MVRFDGGMSLAAVGVNDDGVGSFESTGFAWPTIGIDHRGDPRDLVQALGKEQAARPMLVLTSPMAGRTRNEDDFFVGCLAAHQSGRSY